jgi:hypothetical protein
MVRDHLCVGRAADGGDGVAAMNVVRPTLTIAATLPIYTYDMRDAAINDLRQQLAEARAERDRYIARCVELEIRMEEIRGLVR